MRPTYLRQGNVVIENADAIPIPHNSPLATFAPYRGNTVAELNNMTPFFKGQYVPVLVGNWSQPAIQKVNRFSTYQGGYGSPASPQVKLGLKSGDKGADVKVLQNYLLALGYSVGPMGADSDFGSGTKGALKSFQDDYDLTQSGMVDSGTKAQLEFNMVSLSTEPTKAEAPGEEVSGKNWWEKLGEAFGKGVAQGAVPTTSQPISTPTSPYVPPAATPSGLSTGAMVGIAVGVVGLFGLAIWLGSTGSEEPDRPFKRSL
jgi:hypothetical protein